MVNITLEQARELYNSGNMNFQIIATKAFSREELKAISYGDIVDKIGAKLDCYCLPCPIKYHSKIEALNKLRNIAFFFNQGWEKYIGDEGYSIAFGASPAPIPVDRIHGCIITKHGKNSYHPGIIYFRTYDDACAAIETAYTEGWLNDLK